MNPADHILRTPLIPYRPGKPQIRGKIFLKPENLQPFGSYKIRGVLNAAAQGDPAKVRHGLAAASAGNMAQAVALAAQILNVPCEIYLPDTAPAVKKKTIERLGARIVEMSWPEVWTYINDPHRNYKGEGVFVHPVFTKGLVEGYGTIGDEIIADLADVDAVVIPFGAGGLTLGIAHAIRKLKPGVAIYPCEPSTAAPLAASLRAGHAQKIDRIPSFVDGIGVPEVLPDVFPMLQPVITGSIVVTLDQIKAAIAELYFQHKLVAEGAGGAGLAAAIHLSQTSEYRNIVCIVSGGNLATDIMADIITHY